MIQEHEHYVVIRNDTRGVALATQGNQARSFWRRLRGLMFTRPLRAGEGLVIRPCNSVHMFFVRQALDVIYLDDHDRVVGVSESLRPWRCGPVIWRAKYVVELPAGTVSATGTAIGDEIRVVEVSSAIQSSGAAVL